jgi:hypothetical protein
MALVNRMKGYSGESADIAKYGDVSPGDWYYGAVSSALTAGYITGTGDATISPEKPITRQEAMAIIARIENIAPADDTAVLAGTNDGETAAAWAKGYVAATITNGLIGGSGGNVSPLAQITRAETVTLLDRVDSGARTYAFAGVFGPDTGTRTIKSADITASGAELKNTTVTGDLAIAASVGDGDVTLTNIKVNGNLYVNGGGENTILFNNVDVLGSLVVNKTGGGVRILATGATNVRLTVLESGAILVERELTGGGFERVEISAALTAGQPVVLEGQFTTVENKASGLDLTVNGRVNELISSEDLTVKGTGVIVKLTSTDGAVITNETTETAPATGSGGNNSNNNNNNNDNTGVAVSSVGVEPAALRVQVGRTATLTAGTATAGGETVTADYSYQWLRSRYADEGYEPITGATAASYSPTDADKGCYIRLRVTGDGQTLYGEALSAAKGPVVSIADEVFAAIEAIYLGENADANYVTKSLNLVKDLAAYPALTIVWTADPAGVVNTDTGALTRPEDADARVTLTATLSGLITDERAFAINVLMQGIDNVEQTGTDPRFKPGYPQSYIKDGEI